MNAPFRRRPSAGLRASIVAAALAAAPAAAAEECFECHASADAIGERKRVVGSAIAPRHLAAGREQECEQK